MTHDKVYELKTKYSEDDVVLKFRKYSNHRTAIELISVTDGYPVMVATVNVPDEILEDGEIIIKNYSENEGLLEFLQSNGIVGPTKRHVRSGWVLLPVVDLLIKP